MDRFSAVYESVMSGIDADIRRYGRRHGVRKEDFGKHVDFQGEDYIVTGVNSDGVEIRSVETGETVTADRQYLEF